MRKSNRVAVGDSVRVTGSNRYRGECGRVVEIFKPLYALGDKKPLYQVRFEDRKGGQYYREQLERA